ncbi:MAG: YlmH/Sll1252 family protein [Clostridia bacterium]|nr:YlmH/Sll1252 family protein [Clostridia bacterium]
MMIDKKAKSNLLASIKDKDERILMSSILDKAIKFERSNTLSFTNFLNLNELYIAKKILDFFNVKYVVFSANDYVEKKNIAFVPEYLDTERVFLEHVSCLKIEPFGNSKVLHRDYMGAIYSLGVRRELIGDIILDHAGAYFFCMKNMEEFFLMNLISVGKQEVKVEPIDLMSDEVKNLSVSLIEKECMIPSFRVDALLSEVYCLSRRETKEKIIKGDLFINDKNIFQPNTLIQKDDVISFKKCGKLRVGNEIRRTKSSNIVIKILKYN